ncbi:MAG: glycosyltransferase [bacterium]|nr:glycosyltransferase [bacterium]
MLSIIIPFHNEKDNLPELITELESQLHHMEQAYELILVDDGSTDAYITLLSSYLTDTIKLHVLNRQMGKGKALVEGLKKSHGEIIVFMDADLQDDPADLAHFLSQINQGTDLVNGWRHNRKDNVVIKIYSSLAGWVLRSYLKSPFTDINCGFKMFKREILDDIVLYGNNFRFLPLAAFYAGYRVGEVKVNNRSRVHGSSKFGISKLFIGIIDMFSAYFLYRFAERPLHFFGSIGTISLAIGGLALAWVTYERLFFGVLLYRRPALQYAIFLVILGIQIIMTGVIGELIVYLHHKKKA